MNFAEDNPSSSVNAIVGGLRLRQAGVIFAIALVIHASDHFRRGMSASTVAVQVLGNTQLALSLITIALIMTHHRWASRFAIAVGFASAFGFVTVHLLPRWSELSDAFIGSHKASGVTWYSFVAASCEILAAFNLGVAGLRSRRANTITITE